MKAVVIGAGAMGCRFGAALHRAGVEVWLYDVAKPHVDAINRDGLRIRAGGEVTALSIPATTDISKVPKVDLAILFTKSIYAKSALEAARDILEDGAAVLTLQNGLGNIETIEQFTPRENIIAGITNYATDLIGPGEIALTGDGIARIMPLSAKREVFAGELARLFTLGGCNTTLSADVMVDIWEKVAFNAAFNALTCITQLPVGGVGATEYGRSLALEIASEVVAVANAEGVNADEERVHKTILGVIGPHADHKPSMLQDRIAHRRTEVDSICGIVVEKARLHSMRADCVNTVYRLIKVVENSYLNP
ncbi:MAG: 2-dehydropantoate 2-reductase [Clostridia bacterium]|nr:2-dehydropantoate 2-reductase [Clostridia bacterium]